MTDDKLLHKWINGTISESELQRFQQRPEYTELTKLYRQTEHLAAPSFDKEGTLSSVLKHKKQSLVPLKSGRRVFFRNFVKYAAAASILLIAGWFFFYSTATTTIVAAVGTQQKGQLPDGSIYHLNAESTLAFQERDWQNKRRLTLSGEAFFEVEKGEQFLVQTKNGSVQVLGTKFNVRARGNYLEVKCAEGKVAVLSQMERKIRDLSENEAIRIINNQISDAWQLEKGASSWVQGVSKFRSVALAEILAELERQFELNITNNGVDETTILTANFQHQDLDLALKTVLGTLPITYKIDGNRVTLTPK